MRLQSHLRLSKSNIRRKCDGWFKRAEFNAYIMMIYFHCSDLHVMPGQRDRNTRFCWSVRVWSQGPHSQIWMTGGVGGVRQWFIFYIPKNHNFRIWLPQKITTFFSIHKKNSLVLFSQPKNISLFFSRPKKIPASFIDPKKSLFAKISDPKKSLGPPPRH